MGGCPSTTPSIAGKKNCQAKTTSRYVVVEAMGIPTTFALLLVLLLEVGYHKATVNLLLRIYRHARKGEC